MFLWREDLNIKCILCYNLIQRIGQDNFPKKVCSLWSCHKHLHVATMQSDESYWKWNAYINMHALGCHLRSCKKTLYQALELKVLWTDCGRHSGPPKYILHCVWSSDATVNGLVFLVYTATWWRGGQWHSSSHAWRLMGLNRQKTLYCNYNSYMPPLH